MKVQKRFLKWESVGLSALAFPAMRRTIRTGIALVIRPDKLTLIVPCALSVMLSGVLLAQTQAATPSAAAPPTYVVPARVPSDVREFLIALGDRIQKPGKERLTLIGKHTDKAGVVAAAQLTWEVPGR